MLALRGFGSICICSKLPSDTMFSITININQHAKISKESLLGIQQEEKMNQQNHKYLGI